MSIDTAVSRISSILSMEQALNNPVAYEQALTAGSSGGPVTAASAAGGSTASGSFSNALSSALVSGTGSTTASGWGSQSGGDCSGFVSAVLHAGGFQSQPADTTSLPSQPGILSGRGQYVTIYDRDGSGQAGHVIIEIDGPVL